MMIDPNLSLAISMQSNPGVYALLLGWGTSRSAGIPTGWEVVLDLIRRLASLSQADCEPDPGVWYERTYSVAPDYSDLLDTLAKSPAERSQLLRSYFEPDEDEREQGLKLPTRTHESIADLVSRGFVRVIVTTNFDRLLEQALEAVGVIPTVIASPEAADGALPFVHSRCTVIKVHGDYLDTRIKNTRLELESYDERIDTLLDRVLDEYGLIVCGWSAAWDPALRAAIERTKSHRFTTYWCTRGALDPAAQPLVNLRRAEVMEIADADRFFSKIAEYVSSLEELARPHPLSAKVAVATLKRYIVDESRRIQLHDLVTDEVERLHVQLGDAEFDTGGPNGGRDELVRRLARYEAVTEVLRALIASGCYWGSERTDPLWIRMLERVANGHAKQDGLVWKIELQRYPALLLFYSGGIAALASGNARLPYALATKPRIVGSAEPKFGVDGLNCMSVMRQVDGRALPGMDRRYTPLNDYLFNLLREPLREYLPLDEDYDFTFNLFEYIIAVQYMELGHKYRGMIGRFLWHNAFRNRLKEVEESLTDDWFVLRGGFFGGSRDRYFELKAQLVDAVRGYESISW